MEELGSLFDRHSTDRARSRITYAPVSPHIEILIRGNCESLFPSCVPRIRYDATPRHVTPRTSCYRDFLLSRQRVYKKIRDDRLGARFTRLRVYTPPIFLLSRGKFYGNLARNRIPSREELDDAVHARPSNFPTSIGRTNYANSVT